MSTTPNTARLNFRLPAELKQTIENAAAISGQTVSDFAISVLVHGARTLLQSQNATELTDRDRALFMALLDRSDAKPNARLAKAARRYKRRVS